jgi:DNA helicase-2/ATP-dependent DNA helicase PcrA
MNDKIYDLDQLRAINAHDGYFLVLAPPGCGKTDILAERIVEAKKEGVGFDDMLCLTFTNRASRGMKNRIKERVGEEAKDIFVGNIHRFCSNFLFANRFIPENSSILDEEDQMDLFLSYSSTDFKYRNGKLNRMAGAYTNDLAGYIKQSLLGHPESVKFARDDFGDLYQLANQCNFDPTLIPTDKNFLKYALMYMKYKEERNILDFADILILAYECMLQMPEHKKYKWIQVDEVQDLNALQLAIVDELTDSDPTVMYLGDEQQAIFSFMGAKLDQLKILKNRCTANILTLSNNYRAPKYLLDICNEYAEKELGVDPDLLPKAVKDEPKDKFDVFLTESATVSDERKRIRGMVDYYLKLDDEDRLAILVTKNEEADAISKELSDAGVSNFKISGTDMFKTKSYKTLSSYYAVLANDFNFIAWARLLYGINAIPTLVSARGFMTKMKELMMTPSDFLQSESYLERFKRFYDTREFVFFDTETTGLDVLNDDIVQIAAFKVKNGHKIPNSDFNILLETEKEIPAMLGDIVNPLVDEYTNRPHYSRKEGLQMFIDYVGDDPLLGHNVTYDYLILQNNVQRDLGEFVEYDIFDSLHIVKCVEPGLRQYKLAFLLDALNLNGQNSHLANEDIEATKFLVDYCVSKFEPILPNQAAFRANAKVVNVASRMQVLSPLFENIKSYMYQPINVTQRNIADELRDMHAMLLSQNLIDPNELGSKYDIFLRFVASEWIDYDKNESLFSQISSHIYDITSTINEGDLVNSEDLLSDRVFIMTVYKGKGLEFDNVVVLSASDGNYPFFKINQILSSSWSSDKDRAQALIDRMEDARKFYVAISRAKKRLCVSFTETNANGYRTCCTPFMNSIKHLFTFGKA